MYIFSQCDVPQRCNEKLKINRMSGIPSDCPIWINSATCAYCGREFAPDRKATRDHLIARKFVPEGTLQGNWNILLKACEPCNHRKSTLENDISAITMMPNNQGEWVRDDPRLKASAARKVKGAISASSRRRVAESRMRSSIKFQATEGLSLNFRFVGQPHIQEQRLAELAYYFIQGIWHLVTYDKETRTGRRIRPNNLLLLESTHRGDWGNARMRAFMDSTSGWEGRFLGITADGYFKVVLCKKSETENIWSWALEWNENYRLVGVHGEAGRVAEVEKSLPVLENGPTFGDRDRGFSIREEKTLSDEEDKLFNVPRGLSPETRIDSSHWK